jgi:FixJ family two-component response regulator
MSYGSESEQLHPNPGRLAERGQPENFIAVAVVDDDAAVCDSTQVLLEALGYKVHTYLNAVEFLAASPNIACVVVDYHMSGLNGLELTAELQKRGNTVPVIMITAMSDPRIEAQAAQLGIKSVLKKPLGKGLIEALHSAFT